MLRIDGSLYRSQHELVFVFKAGGAPHINNVELGRHGRYRTNVWTYAGANAFGATRDADLAMHPTVKPVALVADAILDCSRRKGVVLDAFAGSGTTLVAAHKTGRCGYGIELAPLYCDVIVRRLAKVARLEAVHAVKGQPFDAVAAERRAPPHRAAWRRRGGRRGGRRMSRNRSRKGGGAGRQIDLSGVLEAPLRIRRNERVESIHPVEAMLRQHLRKAIVDKSVPSMKFILDQAEKHDVVKKPAPPSRGGVFIVPKGLHLEAERAIFDHDLPAGQSDAMSRIIGIIRRALHGRG